jgi:hypothetical protein
MISAFAVAPGSMRSNAADPRTIRTVGYPLVTATLIFASGSPRGLQISTGSATSVLGGTRSTSLDVSGSATGGCPPVPGPAIPIWCCAPSTENASRPSLLAVTSCTVPFFSSLYTAPGRYSGAVVT